MYDDYKWEISVAQLDFGIESSHLHLPFERERVKRRVRNNQPETWHSSFHGNAY